MRTIQTDDTSPRLLKVFMKTTFSFIFKLSLFLLAAVVTSPAYAADYDGDGKDDLETIKVIRKASNQNAGETRWSVRKSSDGKILTYKFSVPGAALVRLKGSDRKYHPGVVYVKSLNEPLLWIIKTARSQKKVLFGQPGDTIPNQADIDRDGIDDYTVVRSRQDGALEWFTNFSKTKTTRSTVFGSIGHRVMLGADGMLLTVSPSFQWTAKYFDDTAPRYSVTWGQAGDIPMAPVLANQLVVTRPGQPSELFSLHANSPLRVTLGAATTVPMMGKLSSSSITFGWHDRNKKRVYFKNPRKRKTASTHFGDSSSAVMLPSGQVVQPGTNGAFTPAPTPTPAPTSGGGGNNGGGAPTPDYTPTNPGLSAVCPTVRSIKGGEVWKSIASTHIPTTDPRRFSTSFISRRGTPAPAFTCLQMYDGKGNLIHQLGRYSPTGAEYSSRSYGGFGCGDKRSALSVAQNAINNTGSSAAYLKVTDSVCVSIPNPNSCINSTGC